MVEMDENTIPPRTVKSMIVSIDGVEVDGYYFELERGSMLLIYDVEFFQESAVKHVN